MSDSAQVEELPLPKPEGAFAAALGYLIVLVCVLVALANLVFLREVGIVSTVASVAWLLLVGGIVVSNIQEEGGVRPYVIRRLGVFAAHPFLRAERSEQGWGISIGYVLGGRSFSYLKIPTSAITSVQWSPGQATALAGRDMQDWCVAIWYNHPKGLRRKSFPGVRDEEVYLIGPTGEREKVAAFGMQLVRFLTGCGVEFTRGCDDCEFNSASRSLLSEPWR